MKTVHIILLSLALSTAITPSAQALSNHTKAAMLAGAILGGSIEAYQYIKSIEEQNEPIPENEEKKELSKKELLLHATMGAIKGSFVGAASLQLALYQLESYE